MSSPIVPSSSTAAGPPASAVSASASAPATASHVPVVEQSTSKALDDLSNAAPAATGSIFDKVQGFVNQISTQAAPYVDNAGVKLDQFIDGLERRASSISGPAGGTGPATTATPVASTTTLGTSSIGEKSITKETIAAVKDTANTAAVHGHAVGITAGAHAAAVGNTASANANAVAATVSEKAKGLFAAVQSNFEKVTHTIDEKTASQSHPGLVTQLQQAVEKGMNAVDQALNEPPTAGAAVAGGEPVVQTTTNSVPHEHNQPTGTTSAAAPSAVSVTPVAAAVGGASFSGAGLATQ